MKENKNREVGLSLHQDVDADALIVSQQKALNELSEHSVKMQKSLEEKEVFIEHQQKKMMEMSAFSVQLKKDLGNTREYFNQVWREYSQMRNRFYRLRMNKWVGWFVRKDRYLSAGEKLLKKLTRAAHKQEIIKKTTHSQFKDIVNASGVYNGVPHTVMLDVTAQCNLQCIMCFQSVMKKKDFVFGELTDKSIGNSAEFIATAEELKLFATGEPFLSSSLRGLIDMLHGDTTNITISTNGTIYNNQVKPILQRLTTLTVSIDSASKEKFEKIRKNSKFEHIINNVKRMRRDYPSLFMTFAVTVARYNLDECPDIVNLAADLKINHVQFSNMRSLEPGMDVEELHEADREWITDVGSLVEKAAKRACITVEWQV